MSAFDERKNAFESKFAHDAELKFKVEARRNKLIAQWAAEKMNLDTAAAAAYPGQLIAADLEEAGDEDVMRKLIADFKEKGITVSPEELRAQLDACFEQAKESVLSET